jgi:outer membrane protein OmpA-like peptidoglycan-associated protein
MIAAMTSKRRSGGEEAIPSMRSETPKAPTTVEAPVEASVPAAAPAPVVPPAPRATPAPQPNYPQAPAPQAQSGDVLNQTFVSRLQDSGATVSTAPASGSYAATTAQGYTLQQSGTAATQESTASETAALTPLVPASERVAVIGFANGSSSLDSNALAMVRKVVKLYKERGGLVRVVGHSSSRTRDLPVEQHMIVNFNISLKRAQNVANAIARRGVKLDDIMIEARGDSEPLYFEAMPRGEAENRRAEVYLER